MSTSTISANISADEFQALEQKVLRAIEIVKHEREARAAAEAEVQNLRAQLASQQEMPRTRFELAVEEISSGRVIGACDLSLIERDVADLGYMLGTPDWGKGFATEIALALLDAAFFDLRAKRVISTVDVNNRASIRVLEKIGMRWEAVFRKHRRAKNRWWDCHLFVLPREVWEASRGPSS